MRLTISGIAIFAGLAGLAAQPAKESPVKVIHEEPFYVAGYSVRTNNASEMSGHGQIGALWQRFMQQNLGAQILGRTDAAMIVVYSDYASDENGDFSYLLGARVNSVDHLPAGMSYRKIEAGDYAVLTTAQGALVDVLQAEWKKIWVMTPAELGGRRAFRTDYEVYDARSANPDQAQVEIHVGLASASR